MARVSESDIASIGTVRAAELLDITRETVIDLIKRGELAAWESGSGVNTRYKIRLVDLARWQESRRAA